MDSFHKDKVNKNLKQIFQKFSRGCDQGLKDNDKLIQ